MSKFDDMLDGLKQDTRVPDSVWKKYTDTLSGLPERAEKQTVKKYRWVKYAVSAAAVTLMSTAVCYANPALAAKLPLIGNIFEKVEQEATFSGKYSEKAVVLEAEETCKTEDAGLTVTASEIYSDGMSVFLTLQVESEQGGFNNIPGKIMYLEGTYKLAGSEEEKRMENNYLEGKILNDNTFIGMVKYDLDKMELPEGTLELRLSMIGYDDIREWDEKDISAFHKIKGEWNLDIPFTVSEEELKTIPINQESDGYCLESVTISPYQIVTCVNAPYTEREVSREEYEKVMKEKTQGKGEFGITYEEYAEAKSKTYEMCYTMVFNQDGEMLTPREESQGKAVWAVKDLEISKLYIYVVDSFDAWLEIEDKGMDCEAAEQALITAEVDVK